MQSDGVVCVYRVWIWLLAVERERDAIDRRACGNGRNIVTEQATRDVIFPWDTLADKNYS